LPLTAPPDAATLSPRCRHPCCCRAFESAAVFRRRHSAAVAASFASYQPLSMILPAGYFRFFTPVFHAAIFISWPFSALRRRAASAYFHYFHAIIFISLFIFAIRH